MPDWRRFGISFEIISTAEERFEAERIHDQRVEAAKRRVRRKRARRAMRKLREIRGRRWPLR